MKVSGDMCSITTGDIKIEDSSTVLWNYLANKTGFLNGECSDEDNQKIQESRSDSIISKSASVKVQVILPKAVSTNWDGLQASEKRLMMLPVPSRLSLENEELGANELKLNLQFEEIQFNQLDNSSSVDQGGVIFADKDFVWKSSGTICYVKNSVRTWILRRDVSKDFYSAPRVEIELKRLQIDAGFGDYLLIAAAPESGSYQLADPGEIGNSRLIEAESSAADVGFNEILYRRNDTAQVLIENIIPNREVELSNKLIVVTAKAAYITLVLHNHNEDSEETEPCGRSRPALEFRFRIKNGNKTEPEREKVPRRMKDASVNICVQEINCYTLNSGLLDIFQKQFATMANIYLAFNQSSDASLVRSIKFRGVTSINLFITGELAICS